MEYDHYENAIVSAEGWRCDVLSARSAKPPAGRTQGVRLYERLFHEKYWPAVKYDDSVTIVELGKRSFATAVLPELYGIGLLNGMAVYEEFLKTNER